MKKRFAAIVFCFTLCAQTVHAGGLPVVDAAAIAKIAFQIERIIEARDTLRDTYSQDILEYTLNFERIGEDVRELLQEDFHGLFHTVGEIQGLVQELETLDQNFEEMYPSLHKETWIGHQKLSDFTKQWLVQNRETMKGAAKISAQIIQNSTNTQQQVDTLVTSSQEAVGTMQLHQATNQLLGRIATSINELNMQLASYTYSFSDSRMKELQQEEANRHFSKHYFKPKHFDSAWNK